MADDTIAREDIIRMAREAGFDALLPSEEILGRGGIYTGSDDEISDELERFAALVAAAELRRLHEANQLMMNTLRWIDKLCPDEFHYFDKQKPGLQRVLAKMAYDAGGLARSTIEKVEEI